MKQLIKTVLAALAAFTEVVLSVRAESGPQQMVPGFKTNSSYASLGATKYIFVMATAALQANMATNATSSTLLGVLQNDPAVGEGMSIAAVGLSKVVAGGALTANWVITTNASGRAARVQSGDIAAGRVLEAAGADGDVVTAQLFHPVRWYGAP